jgi:hypothetical protein
MVKEANLRLSSRFRNSQIAADFPYQEFVDLSMSWHSGYLVVGRIEPDAVPASLAKQLAAMERQVAN